MFNIKDIQADRLTLSAPTAGKLGMQFCSLRLDSKPVVLKLTGLTIPFEPSVFQGTGQEPRKSMLMNITQEIFDAFATIENFCRQPEQQALWTSSLKPADKYGATLKAKINVTGERAVKFYSAANDPCEAPTDWKNLRCNAVVLVKGIYIQRQGVGLLVDVTHLQYAEAVQGSPFDAMEL